MAPSSAADPWRIAHVPAPRGPAVPEAPPPAFRNPLREGADPFLVFSAGRYHSVHSGRDAEGEGIFLSSAAHVSGLATADPVRIVRGDDAGPAGAYELWAPELHLLDGRWYVYYAADDGDNASHRMYVAASAGLDVSGPYTRPRPLVLPADRWAIDGTVIDLGPRGRFFCWSGWEGDDNVAQNLYLARMQDPCTVTGDRVLLSAPDFDWEQRTGGRAGWPAVNEGPAAVIRGGRVHLTYSASGSWCPDYCLGLLTADLDADLMDAASWKKSPQPIFTSAPGAYGPGHNSFFQLPDRDQTWLVYHANLGYDTGWAGRSVRMQPIGWTPGGDLDPGVPLGPNAWVADPQTAPLRQAA